MALFDALIEHFAREAAVSDCERGDEAVLADHAPNFLEHDEIVERFNRIYAAWLKDTYERVAPGQFVVIEVHTARSWIHPDLDQALDLAASEHIYEFGQFFWQKIGNPQRPTQADNLPVH